MIFQSGEHDENALKIVEKSSNMPKKFRKWIVQLVPSISIQNTFKFDFGYYPIPH